MVVHHFNFTTWPEHGVPESSSTLIQFVKAVRANRHENTTIVVHCRYSRNHDHTMVPLKGTHAGKSGKPLLLQNTTHVSTFLL
jgi:hypothetical protein